jgi:ATP-dependent protease HslVU (ClpYQ) peptidase subunit
MLSKSRYTFFQLVQFLKGGNMSVVACKINENGFEIAADSITTRGTLQTKGQTTEHVKLYETNEMVIGGVGSAEENSLLRLFAETHRISKPDDYSVLEFISEFSEWKKRKTDTTAIKNAFLIGYQGSVFYVNQWHVSRVKTYMAIGAGMSFALAALYLGHSAKKAVETAIELSTQCEEPIIVIEKTSDSKIKKKKKA